MISTKRGLVGILFALFLILSAVGAGLAVAGRSDRQALRQACEDDYKTICKEVQPGGGRIKACLQQNLDKLSPGCRNALTAAKAARQSSPTGQ